MRKTVFLAIIINTLTARGDTLSYPDSKPGKTVDTLHDIKVPDPYRWLEDLNSDQTSTWVKAQNSLTDSFLDAIPGRQALENHLTKLWNVERLGVPSFEGGSYFFSKNNGLQNQSVLYSSKSLDLEPTVLLDPNKLSKDGTVALNSYEVSPDGKYLAYSTSASGSDWVEWKVREIPSRKDLSDHLKWSKFSGVSWAKNSKGFYYGRFPTPKDGEEMMAQNIHKKIYFHEIGKPQSEDLLVYERPNQPKQGLYAWVTEDGKYLLIQVSQGTDTKNGLFYKDLSNSTSKVIELLSSFDASYDFITNLGSKFIIRTDLNAPKQKVISIDVNEPLSVRWETIIPESTETLRSVSHIGGLFIANYLKDARTEIRRFKTDGNSLPPVKLPGLGTASGFEGKSDQNETFYYFTSFTSPGAVYRYDVTRNASTLLKAPKTQFDRDHYESRQIFATSRDGTKIPMFIVSKKNLKLDGNNPTLLYAYGGFNISLRPSYSPATIAWLDLGGIYVMANLRGGGEYGEEWHEAGMKLKKQNVFDDFIACAEHLISNKFTTSKKLSIAGGSNGGLLVGACMVQRPELYGACLPAVGVMDMLRFHKFTIGWAWQAEYGKPEDPEDFKNLLTYSPYHNLKPNNYPATMVITSDHDDRVVPSHSYKFAAALQSAQNGFAPTLIRIESKAGHGAGTPTSKRIEAIVDKYAFLAKALGFEIKL
ncbi:prolyl oligopeptidase family serine peptidase [Akkermansiaceae bacterium]|nr:prolyl oligopeptidase family serine peptidase [Akkermansiaceae bacterium]MDA7528573.1 prolyl oligopeptidase family serine peptidase [Akkermansiaceae bacterium]MDB4610317.1 prolyl oligopeptidase family serine peptidase [Akkermansiaceae bacterium]MDB4719096.1 prolyl oligopeptidase family serine peptidase [Akkermansiaceae bacterium]MDC0320518.1 prolyl oligopeptidase family serine peptidase [Akkermansiaceae bacterium]